MRDQILATQKRSTREARSNVRFGRDANKTLELALRQALRMQHNYIGTEHLLLGVMQQEKDPAAELLTGLGVQYDEAERWPTEELNKLLAARG